MVKLRKLIADAAHYPVFTALCLGVFAKSPANDF